MATEKDFWPDWEEKHLGGGSFGVVKLWHNQSTGEKVAVKVCRVSLDTKDRGRWDDEVSRQRRLTLTLTLDSSACAACTEDARSLVYARTHTDRHTRMRYAAYWKLRKSGHLAVFLVFSFDALWLTVNVIERFWCCGGRLRSWGPSVKQW